MLEEVADLPWSALYALEFQAYYGAAGFLLAAKEVRKRSLLALLLVGLQPPGPAGTVSL
jgi:hypothetical protein